MILRRFGENLKNQNWTAIGIELVILVLGVFIGIQVSNWNGERLERRSEYDSLTSIKNDVDYSILAINRLINRLEYQDMARKRLYEFSISASVAMDPDAQDSDILNGVYELHNMDLNLNTIESMKNAGTLSIIGNPILVSNLLELLTEAADNIDSQNDEFQMAYSLSDPWLIEHYDMSHAFSQTMLVNIRRPDWLKIQRSETRDPLAMKSKQFSNILLYRSVSSQNRVLMATRLRLKLQTIRQQIVDRQQELSD